MKAGLNLFSLNKFIKDEKGYVQTMIKLKELGYDFVQYSGAPYDPEIIKKGSEESGLPVVLTHVPASLIYENPEKLVEEHFYFGCKNIGLGIVPLQSTTDDDEWRKKIDQLNDCALRIKKAGGNFFYHHHQHEFHVMENGQTVMDYMINNAPEINFTLDTYWLQYAGKNPVTFPLQLKGRIGCVHLKDYSVFRTNNETFEFKPRFAPVGTGSLEMLKIIENCSSCGTEYFLVEQDDASSYDDPFDQVKQSIDYLKSI